MALVLTLSVFWGFVLACCVAEDCGGWNWRAFWLAWLGTTCGLPVGLYALAFWL